MYWVFAALIYYLTYLCGKLQYTFAISSIAHIQTHVSKYLYAYNYDVYVHNHSLLLMT